MIGPNYPAVYLSPREPENKSNTNTNHDTRGPTAGTVSVYSIPLAMAAISIVSFCLARRLASVRRLRDIPLARWLVLGVFLDSWLFVLSSTILQASFGLNSSYAACDAAVLLCLVCYLSSKVLIYFFLVEKVSIVRGNNRDSRWKDRLFLFNMFGMMLPYSVVIVLTFVFRNAIIGDDGQCRIGLKLPGNIPLIIFDLTINVYLTYLFLKPLHGLWTFNNGAEIGQLRLRRVAMRTFIGSCLTLLSTLGNLISLLILRGREPGWICFAVCNSDILFSVLVLHWVTHQDDEESGLKSSCQGCHRSTSLSRGSAFHNEQGSRARVTTRIEAGPGNFPVTTSIPLGGILTHTEISRDVESIGASETESAQEINCSTDFILSTKGTVEQAPRYNCPTDITR